MTAPAQDGQATTGAVTGPVGLATAEQAQGQALQHAAEDESTSPQVPAIIGMQRLADPAQERQRALNLMVAAIGRLTWGAQLDVSTRRSVAAYCHHYGIDPLTELDLLGGNVYVNSEFWLRKLGELREAGYITDFRLLHIHADPRLKAIMADDRAPEQVREHAKRVWYDNLFQRIRHNAPEEAEAICVAQVWLRGGGEPVEGCKWGGNGTSVVQPRRGGQSSANPIVEGNSTLSVESQAVRRVMRAVSSHVPRSVLPSADDMDAELALVSQVVKDHKAKLKAQAEGQPRNRAVGLDVSYGGEKPSDLAPAALKAPAFDPYADVEPAKVNLQDAEPMEARRPEQPEPQAAAAMGGADGGTTVAGRYYTCTECGARVDGSTLTGHTPDCRFYADGDE